MNIREISSWLNDRYSVLFEFCCNCFIIQAVCSGDIPKDQSDEQNVIYVLYHSEIPASGLPEKGNYIIIGSDVTNKFPRSNCIMIRESVDKKDLCKDLNRYITETAQMHCRLANLNQFFLSDQFMEPLMDYFFELFQNPVSYADYSHHVLSYRMPAGLKTDLWDSWDNTIKYGRYDPQDIDENFQYYVDIVVNSPSPFQTKMYGFDYYIWTIKNDESLFGFFVMTAMEHPMSQDDLQIITTAANLVALKLGSGNDASGKGNYSEILYDLLSDTIKTEHELNFRMLTRTWTKSDHYQVLLIDLHDKNEKYNHYVKDRLQVVSAKLKHITLDEFELILFEESSVKNSNQPKINDFILQNKLIAGLSDAFPSLFDIKLYYDQAKKAILFGSQYGSEKDGIFRYSDYRFYDFLNDCANSLECNKYYHPVTLDLVLYDDKHKTDFFKTLLVYLECGKSIQKTCKAMYLHKNTVNYRIQRIKELFHIDYDNGEAVLFIYLSLKLYSIAKMKS